MVRSRSSGGREQLDLHLLPGVVALLRGGHRQQPVGAQQRREDARAAGERRDHQPVAHPAEAHPHPVVGSHRGGQLARQPGPDLRAPGGPDPLECAEQRRGEDVEGQRRRDRVAGHPYTGVASTDAQHHRVPGLHGHAVHGQPAGALHHRRGVVVPARRRAGADQDQVGPGGRLAHRRADHLGLVRGYRQAAGLAACRLGLQREHQGVGVGDLARAWLLAQRAQLVTGGQHRHPRRPPHGHLGRARGADGRQVHRSQPVALGQQQLGGRHVLTDRAHVLVGRRGGPDLGGAVGEVHVLAHDHGVPAALQGVAGVHHLVGLRAQQERVALARAHGVGGEHGDAVHGRRVERR